MNRRELEQALEAIHPRCFGWALACCGHDRDEAEEALQASYLKALDGSARFDGRSALRTWFFGVVKRTAMERRRRRFRLRLGLDRWLAARPRAESGPTPEALTDAAERHERLRSLLSELTPRQRELLHLVFYQELTIEEAASVLEVSLGTARTHYERGKARLRRSLARAEKDDERSRPVRAETERPVLGSQTIRD